MVNAWDDVAITRKRQIECEEDITFCKVFLPFYIDFISKFKGVKVLEIGGGTGHLARELAKSNNAITVIEPSVGMFSVAEKILDGTGVNLYCCAIEDFNAVEKFEIIFAHMCLNAMVSIDSLMTKVGELLDCDGVFAFSIPHPCFYNDYKNFSRNEQYDYSCNAEYKFDLSIGKSKDVIPSIPYYHRSLSYYINILAKFGFMVTELKEIWPDEAIQSLYREKWIAPYYLYFRSKKCNSMNLHAIAEASKKLVHGNGWDAESSTKPQTPKNIAISISLEVAELLKCVAVNSYLDTNFAY